MTLFATTFIAATPHLTTGVEFVLLMLGSLVGLVVLDRNGALPEDAATRKRALYALVALVVMSTLYAATTHAAVLIACDDKVSWWEWVFWIC